jgi:PelA/Pel-15E family pectate lyase
MPVSLRRAVLAVMLMLVPLLTATGAAAETVDLSKQVNQPDEWFKGEGRKILDNVVSWQNANGGWWKAYDATKPRSDAPASSGSNAKKDGKAPASDNQEVWKRSSTFDNKATYTELRLLARGYRVTQDPKYREAFDRGLKFIFEAQYPNGGWPQRFPIGDDYGRHITYNDGAMTGVMNLLLDTASGKGDFAWVPTEQRERAKQAFDRGVQCVLDTQIEVNGKLTGWCQQHDAKTLAPTSARTYELPSIVSSETAEILRTLMRIENPSPEVKRAIHAGAAWLAASKMTGKRLVDKPDPSLPKGRDQVLVDDPSATEPVWARFYDIETNRPFFCGRDGVKKWSLNEIDAERRAGYAWIRPFGEAALKDYAKWAAKHGEAASAGASAGASAR